METNIGYHTVEDRGNPDGILSEGPFICSNELAWLGDGYYFWDYEIEWAKWWGKLRYNNNYVICQGDLDLSQNCLDLLGNLKDIKFFKSLISQFFISFRRHWAQLGVERFEDVPIGQFVNFIRKINAQNHYNGVFEYKAIRIEEVDFSRKTYFFTTKRDKFTFFDKKVIVCLYDQTNEVLKGFSIIYPENYRRTNNER